MIIISRVNMEDSITFSLIRDEVIVDEPYSRIFIAIN